MTIANAVRRRIAASPLAMACAEQLVDVAMRAPVVRRRASRMAAQAEAYANHPGHRAGGA